MYSYSIGVQWHDGREEALSLGIRSSKDEDRSSALEYHHIYVTLYT